jgi:hypothetical protein
MYVLQTIHSIADPIIDFAAKSVVYYYSLDSIRSTLEQVILKVALPRFGSFAAPIFSKQAALMAAPSATLVIGQLWGLAIRETIAAIEDLAMALFGKKQEQAEFTWVRIAMSIASFAVGCICRNYIYNFGVPYVAVCLKVVLTASICSSIISAAVIPAIVVLSAPAVTFLVGDILGSIAQHTSYTLMDWMWKKI